MEAADSALRKEAAELEEHLRFHGFVLNRLQDWISGGTPPAAEHILIDWLNHTDSDGIREMIARMLTQKGFGGAVSPLIRAFRLCSDESARWAIGHAIAHIGFKQDHWSDLLALAGDSRFGRGRQFIVDVLHWVKLPETEGVLLALLDDRDVDAFALNALTYCGSYSTYEHLRKLDPANRSALFRRTLTSGVPRLARKLGRRPN